MGPNRFSLLLGCAAVALVGVNAYLLATPVDTTPLIDVLSVNRDATKRVTLSEPVARGPLLETLERPLFAANRRPIVKVAATKDEPAKVDPTPPAQLELRGVMRRGGRMQALIRSGDDPAGNWVPVGGSHGGLHVREIKGDIAIVEAGGQRYELPMTYRRAEKSDEAGAASQITAPQ